ncbi:MAG: hypothetical protein ACI80S_001870, partial [Pseudohongiellaceae bacterium]
MLLPSKASYLLGKTLIVTVFLNLWATLQDGFKELAF